MFINRYDFRCKDVKKNFEDEYDGLITRICIIYRLTRAEAISIIKNCLNEIEWRYKNK